MNKKILAKHIHGTMPIRTVDETGLVTSTAIVSVQNLFEAFLFQQAYSDGEYHILVEKAIFENAVRMEAEERLPESVKEQRETEGKGRWREAIRERRAAEQEAEAAAVTSPVKTSKRPSKGEARRAGKKKATSKAKRPTGSESGGRIEVQQ